MHREKRDFDLAALTWDEKPRRIKLAKDIFASLTGRVELTEGMEVLDFGCGTGLLSLQVLERTGSVTCADSSSGMLEVLESKVNSARLSCVKTIHLKSDDGSGLTGSYDLITMSMALHHVADAASLVRRLAGLLKPGGSLCVADLYPDNGSFHSDNTGVYHFGFTRETMENYYGMAGLHDFGFTTAAVVEHAGEKVEIASFKVFLATGRR